MKCLNEAVANRLGVYFRQFSVLGTRFEAKGIDDDAIMLESAQMSSPCGLTMFDWCCLPNNFGHFKEERVDLWSVFFSRYTQKPQS